MIDILNIQVMIVALIATIFLGTPLYFLGRRYKNEWKILEDLKSRQYTISNKKELDTFKREVVIVSKSILNTAVKTELIFIIYYLEGLRKKYENT